MNDSESGYHYFTYLTRDDLTLLIWIRDLKNFFQLLKKASHICGPLTALLFFAHHNI